jgi:hypothetical protein
MLRKFIFNYGLVTDGCLSVDPTNDEIIQGVYKKKIREGEERLMLAVLKSAVEDFQKYVLARSAAGKIRKRRRKQTRPGPLHASHFRAPGRRRCLTFRSSISVSPEIELNFPSINFDYPR